MRAREFVVWFWKSHFVRGVVVVAGGTAFAQLIGVAFSPIVTRLYGPEAFGSASAFLAVPTVLAPLATLNYALAISMPSEESDARELAVLGTRLALIVAGVVTVVAIVFGQRIGELLGFPVLGRYLWLIGPFVALTGVEQCLAQWLIRKRRFRAIATVASGQAAAVGLARTGLGLISATSVALVATATIGKAVQTALLWVAGRDVFVAPGDDDAASRRGRRRELSHQFRDFPLLRLPQTLLNAISKNLPMIVFSGLFGPAIAGFYALGQRILQLPIVLISRAVGTVILPRLASATQAGKALRPEVVKTTLALAAVGLIPFGFIFAWGPPLFAFAFGPEWSEAGQYARWLSPWLFLAFVNVPAVQSLAFSRSQGFLLGWEVTTTLVKFGLVIGIATVTENPLLTIQVYSMFGAVAYLYLIFESIRRSGHAQRIRVL